MKQYAVHRTAVKQTRPRLQMPDIKKEDEAAKTLQRLVRSLRRFTRQSRGISQHVYDGVYSRLE